MNVQQSPADQTNGNRPRVRVFGTEYCGWCSRAEALLSRRGIPFESVDVTGDAQARADLMDQSGGRRTVPVIFLDDDAIGGYEELARLVNAGGLDHLKTDQAALLGK